MLGSTHPPSATAPFECKRVNLLTELSESSVQALRRIGVQRRYRDRQIVQQRGDSAIHALIVLCGRLRSTAYSIEGTEQLMRWMEPGEISGLSSVLADAPVPVDLVAEGATELLLLPREPLLDLLVHDARTCLLMTRVLSLRVNELFDIVLARASDTLSARVWATLQRLALENGKRVDDGRTALQMSQTDLALAVGASRQRVNEQLRQLQRSGRVRLGYGRLEIIEQR